MVNQRNEACQISDKIGKLKVNYLLGGFVKTCRGISFPLLYYTIVHCWKRTNEWTLIHKTWIKEIPSCLAQRPPGFYAT